MIPPSPPPPPPPPPPPHRTIGTIGREYTKETVQYTDSKEIKTMFHSILCRFLSAFLKIY